ncbi:nucleoporin-interacting protein NIC96 [Vararia minispora EC-137]|uniref:Nucleoporin-interacting protein NIC96 n=1 Tax=Vararia minispora EC-137 TaxID=1314806 RepID=A0ACB8Q933_9AGAM|nr:nucleoporin-interacting protein NIC96 [Vararia minispora EC-137]
MASDLSALLTDSKALTAQLHKPDLPHVNLSLDQIEAQSRRLVSRQPGATVDSARANYLLAQAHVDAPALASSIQHLNASATFAPLQALQDTDVSGYLRHAHEQNIISTIEEARRETQADFYRALQDRASRDWEARKKRVFEELGTRVGEQTRAVGENKGQSRGSVLALSTGPAPTLETQRKMMAYNVPIVECNAARLKGVSYPIIHSLARATLSMNPDSAQQITQNYAILVKITNEPPAIAPPEHAGAHMLNTPILERKHARAYLGDPNSRDAVELRKQIARGSRQALEEQYYSVIDKTLQARPFEAKLGGDPSARNKIRSFLLVRYYRNGEWQDRIELVASQPLWAKLFYLVRTGHAEDALAEAIQYQKAIEHREDSFVTHFRTWLESPDRRRLSYRLPKAHRDHIQSIFNAHMLHSATVDPFKLALYKLIGKLDPGRRTVPLVTATTEDWLWFQLAMVDEEENRGLAALTETLLGYGRGHFEGPAGQKNPRTGVWAAVLLMCGQFERAVSALLDNSDTYVEGVHIAIALAYHGLLRVPSRTEMSDVTPLTIPQGGGSPALSMQTVVWRYVRQFVKTDPKEALQYVYAVTLGADQPLPSGPEQRELTWDLVRRIVVLANSGPVWDELVGGFRPDGSRFPGVISQAMPLLKLSPEEFHEHILQRAARDAQDADRHLEAIKLFNLAGDYTKVIMCLAQGLGKTVGQPAGGGQEGRDLEQTAREIIRHYERMNRAVGCERDAVVKLLKIREAMEARAQSRHDRVLDIMESTNLVPLETDPAKMTRRTEEFRNLHNSLIDNAPVYLVLTMDAIVANYRLAKATLASDANKRVALDTFRTKGRAIASYVGMLTHRLPPEVLAHIHRLNVEMGA